MRRWLFRCQLVQEERRIRAIPRREIFEKASSRDSEPVRQVVVDKNAAMRSCDGLTLRADVYRPDASGKFPVLVMRTPVRQKHRDGAEW